MTRRCRQVIVGCLSRKLGGSGRLDGTFCNQLRETDSAVEKKRQICLISCDKVYYSAYQVNNEQKLRRERPR